MERWREPTEFGFTTNPYIPAERPRPTWKTLFFGALLALIPIVGPAVSAIYIDRRSVPASYDFGSAVTTALIQVVATVLLGLVIWAIFGLVFGISVQLSPTWSGPTG